MSATVLAPDGVALAYEEVGRGDPVVFAHEFAGDLRSWEPQLQHFGSRFRCIAFNARGYPPSEVPGDPAAYSQRHARDDVVAVLDGLGIDAAHVVGLSMGAFAALHVALDRPERCRSIVLAGCGYGAEPARAASFRREAEATARAFRADVVAAARRYAQGPARVQLRARNPRAFAEFAAALERHAGEGSALTQLGVQRDRPSLYDLRSRLEGIDVPTLVVVGDEDEGCLEPALLLKRSIRTAGLSVLPRTGHTCNLEDPDAFNRVVHDFLADVQRGALTARDPRSISASLTGMDLAKAGVRP